MKIIADEEAIKLLADIKHRLYKAYGLNSEVACKYLDQAVEAGSKEIDNKKPEKNKDS